MSEMNSTNSTSQETQAPQDYSEAAASAFASAPWSLANLEGTIPEQFYEWRIIESYPGETLEEDPAARRFKWVIVCEVTKPDDLAGRLVTNQFIIGTEDDPKAQKPSTWANSFAFGNLERLNLKCGCPNKPLELVNKSFGCFTVNNKSRDGDRTYTNLQLNNIFTIGEIVPGTQTKKSQPRYRRSGGANSPAASASTPSELKCPACQQLFPSDQIVNHVRGCKGPGVTV